MPIEMAVDPHSARGGAVVILHETAIRGCHVVEVERQADERGFFARTFDAAEFRRRGLDPSVVECSISFNARAGTLRGLHYQSAPHAEAKLVRCTRGRIFDVAVDLRSGSPTFRRWTSATLDEENRLGLYIPAGCAHGFVTLVAATEIAYAMSVPHHPDSACGIRWNDPHLAIPWPSLGAEFTLSERDRRWPLLQELEGSASMPTAGGESR